METPHTETVVDKAVAFVKDIFGIEPTEPAPHVEAKPEYSDTAPEITAENAIRLDPNPYAINAVGPMNTEAYVPPMDDAERSGREADEQPREKSAMEYSSEIVRRENSV